jgi:Ca-activated chloride channel homolog
MLIAGAGPRTSYEVSQDKIQGVDVALALDVSASMRAEDFKPSRMEAAKKTLKEFVAGFNAGRLALVAFAGRSFTQCPLTTDKGILTDLIDQLDVGSVAIDGTAIGDAVINALGKFKDDAGSRIIILLTDGENNSGTTDPITAARAAAAMGVKIYAIGVGTPEGAPIPAYGPQGQKYYITDPNGKLILAKVDEKTLTAMADITGGEFFRAKDEDALGDIYEKISDMEKKEITIKKTRRYRELFPYPAAAGLVFMLAGGFLGFGRYRLLSGGAKSKGGGS